MGKSHNISRTVEPEQKSLNLASSQEHPLPYIKKPVKIRKESSKVKIKREPKTRNFMKSVLNLGRKTGKSRNYYTKIGEFLSLQDLGIILLSKNHKIFLTSE